MKRHKWVCLFFFLSHPVAAQEDSRVTTANYQLAARFAPYQLNRLTYSTTLSPHWIEGGDRFWYEWETSNGKSFFLVDPARGVKTPIFDNDRIAAELTRLTKDPWDGRHLPIRGIKLVNTKENTLQFEVESSQDEERAEAEEDSTEEEQQQEEEGSDDEEKAAKKKRFHFEYDVATRTLRQLEDWEGPDNHPGWASVSPDAKTVVFARNHNLHMMTGEAYERILDARRGKDEEAADEADEKIEVEETQLSTDGEEHYSYADFERGETDTEREKNNDKRKSVTIFLGARLPAFRDRAEGPARDQRLVGDPLGGKHASRARDLPLRHGRRSEHHPARDPHLRPQRATDGDRRRRKIQRPDARNLERSEVRISGQRRAQA